MAEGITLTAIFEEVPVEEGGGYSAFCEEISRANTQGETLEEARENLKEAIQLILPRLREKASALCEGPVIRERITIPNSLNDHF